VFSKLEIHTSALLRAFFIYIVSSMLKGGGYRISVPEIGIFRYRCTGIWKKGI